MEIGWSVGAVVHLTDDHNHPAERRVKKLLKLGATPKKVDISG